MTTPVEEVLQNITLPFSLHDYQVEDINTGSLVPCFGEYAEMGLGKTVIGACIGVYKLLHGYNSVIVLLPASLGDQWVAFVRSLGLLVCDYQGTPKKREGLDLDADFIVMSYQIYQRDYERVSKVKDPYFVIDEGTVLCSTSNLICKMTQGGLLERRKKVKLTDEVSITKVERVMYKRLQNGMCILTGTPISNPTDAYGLIRITNPDAYRNEDHFLRQHVAKMNEYGAPLAYKNLDKLHENLTTNAVIREVGDHLDLPPIIYNVIKYDLSKAHLKIYRKLVDEQMLILEDGSILDATSAQKLYWTCQKFIFNPADYKKDPVGLDLLDSVVADTKMRLIFANHVGTNERIMGRYKCGGCFSQVSKAKQKKFIIDFQEGRLETLTANPASGGIGLNFQVCNQIAFAELPVTPKAFRQAVARCRRQGQDKRVVVTILVAKNTIQTKLLRGVMQKADVSEEALHSKESLRRDLMGE